jgi:iron complex transport system permease protein
MKRKFGVLTPLILIIIPLLVGFFAMTFGRYPVGSYDVFNVLLGKDVSSIQLKTVILNIRLPRVMLALIVGAGLSVAGVAFQSLFGNPLATPDTLGVASGASLGAVIAIMLELPLIGVQVMAMVFGLGAVALTFMVVTKQGMLEKSSIILAGIIIGALFNALISLVKYTADVETQLPAISYWLMGSLSSANYKTLLLGAPPIIIGMIILFAVRWRMNMLSLNIDEANATGTNMKFLRFLTIAISTAITASCVSMCGQVGWVGLLVPHICRLLFGANNSKLIPASISIGSIFLVVIDTVARSATGSEIPISVLTAILGAPFFILLLRNSSRGM